MPFASRVMSFARNLLQRRERDNDLDDEIRSQLELLTDQKIKEGLPPNEARRAAKIELGGVEQLKEQVRAVRTGAWLDSLLQDIRFALRMLRKNPGFTAVAVLTLALGIGANTAIFSVVNAVLLKPLPYNDPDRLTVIWQSDAEHRNVATFFNTYSEFEEWRQHSESFDSLAVATWAGASTVLSWQGEPERVLAIPVSENLFSLLGVEAAEGRTFLPQDLSAPCSVVLSDAFWRNTLGTASLVGGSLILNGQACTVVGIMPKSFSFFPKPTQLWTLITPESRYATDPWNSLVGVFGRLKTSVSRANAQAELTTLEQRILPQAPADFMPRKPLPVVLDLQSEFTWLAGRKLRTSLLVLFASVIAILCIACINVASLLLGRTSERLREMGVRSALGAGRARIVRQLLTESILISAFGALAGIIVAAIAIRYFNAANVVELPPGNPVAIDTRVLFFTIALSLLTGALFGLLPALKASRIDLNEILKSGHRGTSLVNSRGGAIFVIAEVALSVVLLSGATLLIESLSRLTSTNLGFQIDHLLKSVGPLPTAQYTNAANRLNLLNALEQQVGTLSGVIAVGFGPLMFDDAHIFSVRGAPPSAEPISTNSQAASANYFAVVGIPLLQGREFDSRDEPGTQPVAIVNETLAHTTFPRGDAIGQEIKLGQLNGDQPWLTIVGVVGDVVGSTIFNDRGFASEPYVYRPLDQTPNASVVMFVRTASDPSIATPAVRKEFLSLDRNVPPPSFISMSDWLSQSFAQPRLRTILLGAFAALALLLCIVGIYGIASQEALGRRREIGIRMALGALPGNVLLGIIARTTVPVIAGLTLGTISALVGTRFLRDLLYGVHPANALTFTLVGALLLVVAAAACYIPARRAMRVDPMVALRHE